MEERKLRSRLILIYVATIVVILAALLIALLCFSAHEIDQSNRESFSTLLTAISDELQNGDIVVYSQLNRLERENRLMLRINDNGSSLLYNAQDDEQRLGLFAKVEQTAAGEGYDIASLPLTSERKTSPVNVYYEDGARYLGAVSIIPIKTGYRTLTILQQQDDPGAGKAVAVLRALPCGCPSARQRRRAVLIDRALPPQSRAENGRRNSSPQLPTSCVRRWR
jgi:hypothetical protein